MNISIYNDKLTYLPVFKWLPKGPRFSVYRPIIKSSLKDSIIFNWKDLLIDTELVSSIIENVFNNPFDDWDCLEFVAKVLGYKNTKLHHWWIKNQNLLQLQWGNKYIGYLSDSKNLHIKWNHIIINLDTSAIENHGSSLTLWKLGTTDLIVFAQTSELNKVYWNKLLKWYFDDSSNFKLYVTDSMKNMAKIY